MGRAEGEAGDQGGGPARPPPRPPSRQLRDKDATRGKIRSRNLGVRNREPGKRPPLPPGFS